MTSPKDQSDSPVSPPPATETTEYRQLQGRYDELCQIVWNLVRQYCPNTHTAVVDPKPSDPLWELAFLLDEDLRVRILSGTIPEPSEQDKKHVVRFLRGTNKTMMDALAEFSLRHPPSYFTDFVKDRIVLKDGKWDPVPQPSIIEKAKEFVKKHT